jgi:hypothetical protein
MHESQCLESAEKWIHSTFGKDQIGVGTESPQDFESIEFAVPQGSEYSEFDASFAKLNLPLVGRIGFVRACWCHDRYLAIQGIRLSIALV